MIDNILDLSRIEARRTSFNLEEIDLPSLLEGLLELVRPQFEAKNLGLTLDFGEKAPVRISNDPDKLRQILKNFLSNAVKFTEAGEIVIGVGPEAPNPAISERVTLKFSVKDDASLERKMIR